MATKVIYFYQGYGILLLWSLTTSDIEFSDFCKLPRDIWTRKIQMSIYNDFLSDN